MEIPENLAQLFHYIDNNKKKFIETLGEAIAIKSVSSDPSLRGEVDRMVRWYADHLAEFGAEILFEDVGTQLLLNGTEIPLPKVLLGTLGNSKDKKTVLVYGHVDVMPASKEDGWDTEPFEMVEQNGKLYGRGSTDDKGPIIAWLNAIEAYRNQGIDIPVNIKFLVEGMEESGSLGTKKLLSADKRSFFEDVDFVCISDNYWLGTNKPCITYGLRGTCSFSVEIECAKRDLHSGIYGGAIVEAMSDMVYVFSKLITEPGNRLDIPGFYDDIAPLEDDETEYYETIDFDVEQFRQDTGCYGLIHKNKECLLMHRWRYPCLSFHGIEGAFSGPGHKAVIPAKIVGKFSVRIVPNQNPAKIERCIIDFIHAQWRNHKSPNKIRIVMTSGSSPWIENYKHPHYEAGSRAAEYVYRTKPDFIREGGTIPVTLLLQEITGKNIILLSLGAGDDGAHSQNEKIDIRNFIEGSKVLAAYLYEIGQIT